MRCVFRVDAGRQIGYGHVYRCLVLADALARSGGRSTFVTRSHEGHLAQVIQGRGHDLVVLPVREEAGPNPSSWLGDEAERDAEVVSKVAAERRAHVVIADHYAIDRSWTLAVRRAGSRLVVLDDLADRLLACDLLVNHNLHAERISYGELVSDGALLLLGATYALLAPEFASARSIRVRALEAPRRAQRLVIALGGSDPMNVTTSILASLVSLLPRPVRVDVIIGQAHPHPELVRQHASVFAGGQVHVQASSRCVANLLAHADVAIGAGGSSALERLCVGVPSIIIEVAPNQRGTVETLAEAELALPYRLGADPERLLPELVTRLLDDDRLRNDIQLRGQQLVDGRGALRVTDALGSLTAPENSVERR